MAGKTAEQTGGGTANRNGDLPSTSKTVKVTLHLAVETAQRLGIESAMRRISQSAIAEEVLSSYLSRWPLPKTTDPET